MGSGPQRESGSFTPNKPTIRRVHSTVSLVPIPDIDATRDQSVAVAE
jgi:hypothetical protein